MPTATIHILIVEDETAQAELLRRAFASHTGRFHLTIVGSLKAAHKFLAETHPDLVMTDWRLPDGDGITLLPNAQSPSFPLVVMASHGNEQVAVEAIKAGALDYVAKSSATLMEMPHIAERALREWSHITERKKAEERERAMARNMRAVADIADELIACPDLNTFYRRAVELARERLGVERCSIFIIDSTQQYLQGTYGTNAEGQTADERTVTIKFDLQEQIHELGARLWVAHERDHTYWDGEQMRTASKGWVVTTVIRMGDQPIGVFFNDAAITQNPIDEVIQETLVVYGSLLGSIVERKRAEAALRDSEERYRALYEDNPSMYFTLDPEGKVLSVNRFGAEQLGYTAQELVGQSVLNVFYEADRESVRRQLTACLQNADQLAEWQFRKVRKDGSLLWVRESVRVTYADGSPVILVVCEDITERKQAADREQRRREWLEKVLDLGKTVAQVTDWQACLLAIYDSVRYGLEFDRVGFFLYDLEHNAVRGVYGTSRAGERQDTSWFVEAVADNRVFREGLTSSKWFAYTPDYSAQYPDTPPEDDIDGVKEHAVVAAWAGDQPVAVLAVDNVISGRLMNEAQLEALRLFASYAGLAIENARLYAAVQQELAERKQAEAALRESEARWRVLTENAPQLLYIIGRDGKILFINHALPGLRAEEIVGSSIYSGVAPEGLALMRQQVEGVFETAASATFDVPAAGAYGAAAWYTCTLSPLVNEEGQVSAAILNATDITARKQADEERMRRLAELEAVNRISTALRAAQTLDEMLPRLLDETLAVVSSLAGVIWLYDAARDELQPAAARGWFTYVNEMPMKPSEGIGGSVFATAKPYLSREFVTDPRARESTRPQIPAGWGGACVPIQTATETVGVFFVSVQLPRELKPEEVHLLTTLAEIAGNAIHRMRLHAQTMLHVQRLSALRTIDMTITATLDLRVTLNVLLEEVINQLRVDAADVLLLDERTQTLEYAAGRGFRRMGINRTRMRLGEGQAGRVALEGRIISLPNIATVPDEVSRVSALYAEGFQAYYGVPLIAKGHVKGVLELFHRTQLNRDPEWHDFLETLAGQAALAIDDAELFDRLRRSNAELTVAYDATIEGWSRALELRDQETEGHTQRVTELTLRLARAMGMSEDELIHVRRGALLHDIGKMGIPDGILMKPSGLTEEEWVIMRKHPVYAHQMLAPIVYLRPALDIPYCHHEKWDATGYPRQLKGDAIPLAARIFTVADIWDALRSDRPYRSAWSEDEVREHIRNLAGTHLDPQVVAVFLSENHLSA